MSKNKNQECVGMSEVRQLFSDEKEKGKDLSLYMTIEGILRDIIFSSGGVVPGYHKLFEYEKQLISVVREHSKEKYSGTSEGDWDLYSLKEKVPYETVSPILSAWDDVSDNDVTDLARMAYEAGQKSVEKEGQVELEVTHLMGKKLDVPIKIKAMISKTLVKSI